jgi:transcriptional regulator with XRE-family HTH domain
MIEETETYKKDGRVDPVDVIIAQRLLRRRCLLGYSQKDLADYAGVSIQQIQKYEKSTNRISSGRLYRFAKLLKTPIDYFFDSIDEILDGKGKQASGFAEEQALFTPNVVDDLANEREIINLVKLYNNIQDQNVRKKFVELIRAVSSIAVYA